MIPATASAVDPLAPWREPFATEVRGSVAPVVVGCSGGADSVALLALAADAGLSPIAVHVDHGLREGSGDEARAVGTIATQLGTEVRAVRAPVTAGPNLEARAREARYGALERTRVELDADVVLSVTPPTTRPRPSCSTCCGVRRVPGSRGWRPGTGTSCARCSGSGARRRARCARRWA